jgi:hypothetical protein
MTLQEFSDKHQIPMEGLHKCAALLFGPGVIDGETSITDVQAVMLYFYIYLCKSGSTESVASMVTRFIFKDGEPKQQMAQILNGKWLSLDLKNPRPAMQLILRVSVI